MAFVNNYTPEPPIPESELYGPDPYDLNFVFQTPPSLSTDKLQLIPFIPRVHAAAYFDGMRGHQSTLEHLSDAVECPTEFLRFLEKCRRDKSCLIFAAFDNTYQDTNHAECGGSLAAVLGLLETDTTRLITEIGPVIALPAFRRTHVASHAVGLLLKYVLELPPAGLGFRKVKWTASPINAPSNQLAKRMGFSMEALLRWKYMLSTVQGYPKVGKEARTGDAGNGLLGRDSNEWALCWDDWEENVRELVERAFARVA